MGFDASIKVGLLTASVSRRGGGLFAVLPPLARGIAKEGCDVRIFSLDEAASGDDLSQWDHLSLTLCEPRGPQAFGYAPGLGEVLDAADLDLVHAHGLWMYPSVLSLRWAMRFNKPFVVSPHGMLDPWAVRNSAWKKRLAGWLYENRNLARANCLHALNHAEYRAIRAYGLNNPVAIIPNGIDLPLLVGSSGRPAWATDMSPNAKVMLFLGRLHSKKGLANLLQAWSRLAPDRLEDWHLVVAGWDQSGHSAELRRLVETLQLGKRVHLVGPQFDAEKAASLAFANAFILPSLSEGLPMAVLEAWAYRLPVLMTAQCNLTEGFSAGAAMELLPTPECMVEGLARFFELPEQEQRAMGNRGRQLVEERFTWSSVAEMMSAVYAWCLGRRERPAFVRVE